MPKYVYKFLPANKSERIDSILARSQLFFAKPEQLDDPFEFSPRDIIIKKFKRVFPANPEWREAIEAGMLSGVAEISKRRKESLSGLGVCCFSATRDEVLLWSHYAEGHKGIAIEFDTSNPFFSRLFEVKYSDHREPIGIKGWKVPEIISQVLLVKSVSWAYQREWRLLSGSGGQTTEFPSESITSVILGKQSTDETKVLVDGMIKCERVRVYKAHLSGTDYRLSFLQIK